MKLEKPSKDKGYFLIIKFKKENHRDLSSQITLPIVLQAVDNWCTIWNIHLQAWTTTTITIHLASINIAYYSCKISTQGNSDIQHLYHMRNLVLHLFNLFKLWVWKIRHFYIFIQNHMHYQFSTSHLKISSTPNTLEGCAWTPPDIHPTYICSCRCWSDVYVQLEDIKEAR